MNASQIREKARSNLEGKWEGPVLVTLIYMLTMIGIGVILNFIPLGSIISMVITVPLAIGYILTLIKIKKGEEFKYLGFFEDAFQNFTKIWGVTLRIFLKILIPYICVVASIICIIMVMMVCVVIAGISNSEAIMVISIVIGVLMSIIFFALLIASYVWMIIKSLLYSLSYYIMYDNPEMTALEIVEKSKELMEGHRGELFYLELTFIGWAILSVITLGIGYLWLMPYIQNSLMVFYDNRINGEDIEVEKVSEVKEEPKSIEEKTK